MSSYEILKRLRELSLPSDYEFTAPSDEEIEQVERKIGVTLPPSYRAYLVECPNVHFGAYPLLCLETLVDAAELGAEFEVPQNLIPFVEDNCDFFCFDISTQKPEYQVAYWSHNGWSEERWTNFLAWVEQCWIASELKRRERDKASEE